MLSSQNELLNRRLLEFQSKQTEWIAKNKRSEDEIQDSLFKKSEASKDKETLNKTGKSFRKYWKKILYY